jgi:NADPH:quinone reductase-like Zn-dependent oxidoreductase
MDRVHPPATIPTHMQVWECQAYGGPQVLALARRQVGVPGPRQVLVRVEAATVESGDVRIRSQRLPRGFGLIGRLIFGWQRPRQKVLGSVLAGTVVAVGQDVQTWQPGDAVVATTGIAGGAHGEWVLLRDQQAIVRRPVGLSAAQAAAVVFGGMTARYFLDRAAVQAGERVLVIGATGSVGNALLQLAREQGAHVTALASAGNLALARELGAAQALDYRQHALSGRGAEAFDAVADTCQASSFDACLPLLRPGGRYLNIAGDLPSMLARPRQGRRSISGSGRETAQALQAVLDLAAAGTLRPVVDSTWPFADLPAAHARAESGHKRGCVVVQVQTTASPATPDPS